MATLLDTEKYSRYYRRIGIIYQRPEIKASLEVIFSVFMVTLLIFVAIRPTLINLAALQKKIADKESVSSKADKKIAQLFEASNQLTDNSALLPLFDSAVPSQFSYFGMVGRLEIVSRLNNVDLESVSIKGVNLTNGGKPVGEWSTKILKSDGQGIMTVPIDFTISGKPEQVKKFFVEIEKMDRLGVLKTVSLSKESGSTKGTEKIKGVGQINYYVYQQKQ